ncbi:MAG: hypothetical protein RMM10_07525 [Anaerolineae bacterium]|uniref:hypothetical protein n=1 Tax=Thermoflexus sp. TaxID=1969742 RepID=UPI0025D212B2|nr:hypothetical protein [Thermoflexus sp.]MCS7351358.1 hypothetical protein [Thermoflexus sp.]MDW8180813.1 hypothetical protein [Anaerolineae bacterium]
MLAPSAWALAGAAGWAGAAAQVGLWALAMVPGWGWAGRWEGRAAAWAPAGA